MIYTVLEDNFFYIVTIIKTATDKKKLEGGLNKKGMYHPGFERNITYTCNRTLILKIKS